MSRTFRPITLAAALLVLCSSATYASSSAGRLAPEGLLAAMWEQVVAWFAPAVPASSGGEHGSFWEKEGSSMDPNGVSCPATALGGGGEDGGLVTEGDSNK